MSDDFDSPSPIWPAILRSGLAKLDECRAKCPGVGGDVDAMNLRFLLKQGAITGDDRRVIEKAAHTLASLSHALNIDAAAEVRAMRLIYSIQELPGLLGDTQQALAHALHVTKDNAGFSTSIALRRVEEQVRQALAAFNGRSVASPTTEVQIQSAESHASVDTLLGRFVEEVGYCVQQAEPGAAVYVVGPAPLHRYIARMEEGTETEQIATAQAIRDAFNRELVAQLGPEDIERIKARYARADEVSARIESAALPSPAVAVGASTPRC